MLASDFHHPPDIQLPNSPLLEAWLEIRWHLEPVQPGMERDPRFPFALGIFYETVKDHFPFQESLKLSQAPIELFPHKVRYRFRPGEDRSPLLQLGPGVATVNYTADYNWDDFKETALYLRDSLLAAYRDGELHMEQIVLRYRNGEPFDFGSNDFLDYLHSNLNTRLQLPGYVPGHVAAKNWPTGANIRLEFDLLRPRGSGVLLFASGARKRQDPTTHRTIEEDMLIWQLQVASQGENAPELVQREQFSQWLAEAHAVAHDWFFSLVEGPNLESYRIEE